MPSSMFEIVMLPNGDVVLQRVGRPEDIVVKIAFSEEASIYLQDAQLDVARAMIDAGIEAVEALGSTEAADQVDMKDISETGKVLH